MIINTIRVAQFLLEKLIGKGGSSKVYMAINIETNEKVAIKILRNDKGLQKSKALKLLKKNTREWKLLKDILMF